MPNNSVLITEVYFDERSITVFMVLAAAKICVLSREVSSLESVL